jgi:molecular chaperone HtpG
VKKISKYITKKVGDKLSSMFKNDRVDFEKKWDDIKVFIEYGMLTEDKFFDKAQDFSLYKNTENLYSTFEELNERLKTNHSNKDGKTIILYTHDKEEQYGFVESATNKGYEVIEMEGPLVSHVISRLEGKNSNVQFCRVDADSIEKLIEKEDATPSLLTEQEETTLKGIIENEVEKDKFTVDVQNLSTDDAPFLITQSEFMRRMKEQQMSGGGGMQMFGNLPDSYNLVVNSNHSSIGGILAEKNEVKQSELVQQFLELALLSQGLLKGKELTDFVKRSVEMIKN